MRWLLVVLISILLAAPAAAQTFPERNRAAVVDAANVIPDADEAELNAEIVAWVRDTGHQFAVATVPSLEGRTIAVYANGLFRHWGLGGEQSNDGVLLLLAPNERAVRIEVGYGLEGVLTDALTSVIIRDAIRPGLQKNDIADALGGGARRIMAEVTTQAEAAAPEGKAAALVDGAPPAPADPPFPWGFFLFLAVAIFGPIILIFRARRKRRQERAQQARRDGGLIRRGEPYVAGTAGTDALASLSARADSSSGSSWSSSSSDSYSSSSWDSSSSSSSSSDSGFDSGGGSSGGGGSDSNY